MLQFKAWYFAFFGGEAVLWPFLPVWWKLKGLEKGQIGILGATAPLVSTLVTPAWGYVVDVTRRPRLVLACTLTASIICKAVIGLTRSFPVFLSLVVAANFLGSQAPSLVDALCLDALVEKGDYGKQRLWGAVSWGTMSFVMGSLYTYTSLDFMFFCYPAVMAGTVAASLFLPTPNSMDGGTSGVATKNGGQAVGVIRSFVDIWRAPGMRSLLAVAVLMGISMGVIGNYLFLFLDELGGSEALMGLSLTVTCAAEIPMLFFSGWVIRRVGVIGVLYFVLATYFVRLMYYSMLSNAWAVLPIETLHGITFGCGFSAGTMRAAELSPPGLVSTTQGLFNAAFFGLGSGIGVLGGGIIYQHFGAVVLFRIVACVMGGGLILFAWSERYSHMDGAGYETVSVERDEQEKTIFLSPLDIDACGGRGEEGQAVELVSEELNTQMLTDLKPRQSL